MTAAIEVSGLRKTYGPHIAVRDATFTVPRGEIFGFVGPNGAGKTSTIRVLATLLAPDAGRAAVAGIPVDEDPAGVRGAVGYMPDVFGVYDRLTAVEYLEFYAACHAVPRSLRRRRARELLALVDLEARAEQHVDELSRGLQQRLCLARALVHDPPVLLLDEPAAGLDPRARVQMRELVRSLRRAGKTILVSSHILPELEELCTWVGFIDRGAMVAVGPMAEVRDRMQSARVVRVEVAGGDRARDDGELRRLAADADGAPGVVAASAVDGGLELRLADDAADDELLRWLVLRGVRVRSFAPVTGALSDAFLRLTSAEEDG